MMARLNNSIASARAYFRGNKLFGPLIFTLVTVALVVPFTGGVYYDVAKFSLFVVGGGLGIWAFATQQEISIHKSFRIWALLWFGWVAVSSLAARDILAALWGSYGRFNNSFVVFVLFAWCIWVVVALGKRYRNPVIFASLLVTGFIALLGVLQSFGIGYYGGIQTLVAITPDRVPSTLGNPNYSSWWVACMLPVVWVYAIQARGLRGKLCGFGFVFLLLWSLAVFSSRGALLAAALSTIIVGAVLILLRQWRQFFVVCIVAIGAAALFSGYFSLYRTVPSTQVSAFQDSSAVNRYVAWDMAGVMAKKHWLFGVGPGNFEQYYWEYLPSSLMGGEQYFDDAHHTLLALLSTLGVPGLVLFMVLVALAGVYILRAFKARSDALLMGGLGAALCSWIVASLFNPAVTGLWMLLGVIFGLILVPSAVQQVRSVHMLRTWGLRIIALILCYAGLAQAVSDYSLVYASRLYGSAKGKADYELAHDYSSFAARIAPWSLEAQNVDTNLEITLGYPIAGIRDRIHRNVALHPQSVRTQLFTAQLCAALWYMQRAQEDLACADSYASKALAHNVGFQGVEAWYAYYLWASNRTDSAVVMARYATERQPRDYFAWLLLAKIYRDRGNVPMTDFTLGKAQKLTGSDPRILNIRKHLKETGETQSIDLVPTDPYLFNRFR